MIILSLILGSGPRMSPLVGPSNVVGCHVGVDLGGGDIGVAEHRLHAPQVGPPFQQVGRERVPQLVGRDRLGDPGLARVAR